MDNIRSNSKADSQNC